MSEEKQKDFILLRIVKKIFLSGLINILPTILVISILVIAYNFLEKNLGSPINALIKKQLAGNWKTFAIEYLKIDSNLYEAVKIETYEQLVKRVQNSSISFLEVQKKFLEVQKMFQEQAIDLIQKKESTNDFEYKKFLEKKIEQIKETTGFNEAKNKLNKETLLLKRDIEQENQIRLNRLKLTDDQPEKLKNEINKKYPSYIGVFISFFFIFVIGIIINTFAGRSLNRYWDKTIASLPLIKNIYPYTKQLTEFLFANKKQPDFKSVALIEYPRKGLYALGFPTGEFTDSPIGNEEKIITVFIPSSPTPFTGYTVFIPEKEVIPLSMSVEQAIRLCVTGGVIKPSMKKIEPKTKTTIEKKLNE